MAGSVAKAIKVATALTVYGIETFKNSSYKAMTTSLVATALTVYGIETKKVSELAMGATSCNSSYRLRY